jgi:hypothetical protein
MYDIKKVIEKVVFVFSYNYIVFKVKSDNNL